MVMRDVMPAFVLTELIALLRQEKMVRPGYHTLQAVISKALAAERRRLSEIVEKALDRDAKTALTANFWFGRKPCLSWRRSNKTPRTSDTA